MAGIHGVHGSAQVRDNTTKSYNEKENERENKLLFFYFIFHLLDSSNPT